MTDKEQSTLGGTIESQIKTVINEQPRPDKCEIIKVYSDGYVDIKSETYGYLKYIQSITNHEINDISILVFLNNDYENRMVI